MKKEKFTFKEFNQRYPNDDACLQELFENRYKNDKTCSSCHKPFRFYKVTERKCYACAWCSHQLHPLNNTIFHKSSTPLKSWFYAMFLFSKSKNGVSAKELERQLGVTYKTAWRVAKQIRSLLDESVEKLKNEVEVDETYIGGQEYNKHANKKQSGTQGRNIKSKTPIIGAVERKGKIIARVWFQILKVLLSLRFFNLISARMPM